MITIKFNFNIKNTIFYFNDKFKYVDICRHTHFFPLKKKLEQRRHLFQSIMFTNTIFY